MTPEPAIAIIPARFASTRLPGKPLIPIGGIPMIRRVYERVRESGIFSEICVATDHGDIADLVRSFGGQVLMTSPDCVSGTDRCAEAMRLGGFSQEIVVNVQGDEPFVSEKNLATLAGLLRQPGVDIATLCIPLHDPERIFNPNVVKVVCDQKGKALYFSRHPIPFVRGTGESEWSRVASYRKHLGLYGYRREVLQEISLLPPGRLEMAESLEQLRWLEAGYPLHVGETDEESPGIDTADDIRMAEAWLMRQRPN